MTPGSDNEKQPFAFFADQLRPLLECICMEFVINLLE
jgi:hypothetical protein